MIKLFGSVLKHRATDAHEAFTRAVKSENYVVYPAEQAVGGLAYAKYWTHVTYLGKLYYVYGEKRSARQFA